MKIMSEQFTGEELAKEIVWLAWLRSHCVGMGFLQDNPDATKEDVWKNASTSGDYPGGIKTPREGEVAADYVFGRMMKLYFKYGANYVEMRDNDRITPDYQSWCGRYPTYGELVDAAFTGLREDHEFKYVKG